MNSAHPLSTLRADHSPNDTVLEHLISSRSGPRNYRSNVRAILELDRRLHGHLRLDTLAQRIEWSDQPGVCAIQDIEVFFERVYRLRPQDKMLREELLRVASPMHPVVEYLDGLEWV